jgi:hypothetical protein
MRRKPRRPMYFVADCLRDGTVMAAHVDRKPSPHVMKRDNLRIDPDGVFKEFVSSGRHLLSDVKYEDRTRFQDILANSLNARRAIRALVLPQLESLVSQVAAMQEQLQRIEDAIRARSP